METKTIHEALSLFRENIEPIKKGAENPFFHSKYADLSSILQVIKPLLKQCRLSLTHYVREKDGNYSVVTMLRHLDDGEFIESSFPLVGSKAQEFGSAITYARRYNIQAIFDLPTEDDDGNIANEAPKAKSYGKFDLGMFIEGRIRQETDSNHLVTLYEEAMSNKLSEKQIAWLKKECNERKEKLTNS